MRLCVCVCVCVYACFSCVCTCVCFVCLCVCSSCKRNLYTEIQYWLNLFLSEGGFSQISARLLKKMPTSERSPPVPRSCWKKCRPQSLLRQYRDLVEELLTALSTITAPSAGTLPKNVHKFWRVPALGAAMVESAVSNSSTRARYWRRMLWGRHFFQQERGTGGERSEVGFFSP